GHLVPRADGSVPQGGGDQPRTPDARAERDRREPGQDKGAAVSMSINTSRRALLAALALAPLGAAVRSVFAQTPAGVIEIKPQQPVESDKIDVVEFFWYGCIHCYNLEPQLESWAKKLPADAQFRRVPAIFNERWAHDAAIFYAFEALGALDK